MKLKLLEQKIENQTVTKNGFEKARKKYKQEFEAMAKEKPNKIKYINGKIIKIARSDRTSKRDVEGTGNFPRDLSPCHMDHVKCHSCESDPTYIGLVNYLRIALKLC